MILLQEHKRTNLDKVSPTLHKIIIIIIKLRVFYYRNTNVQIWLKVSPTLHKIIIIKLRIFYYIILTENIVLIFMLLFG